MIRQLKVSDDNNTGTYTIYEVDDVEFVNPVEHFAEIDISMNVSMIRDLIQMRKLPIPLNQIEDYAQRTASKEWLIRLKEIEETLIPDNLVSILKTKTKREQVNLLKNLSFTSDQLIAFIFKAYNNFGFRYSQYKSEHHHSGLDVDQIPKIVELSEGKINKVGETNLTNGQLKQAVEHRKVIITKFLDSEDSWHCFFITYDSLKGKEKWKGGQPHYHYISDKFGITRTDVVKQLQSKNYHLGNLPHIDLIDDREDFKSGSL